jgi:hypothetical protein
LPTEWWHFDLIGWENYPVLSLAAQSKELADSSMKCDNCGLRSASIKDLYGCVKL